MWLTLLLMFLGILACSTSVVFIKQSESHVTILGAYRLLLAAAFLSPMFFRSWAKHRAVYGWRHLLRASWPGLILALHFITWNAGARATKFSNASLLVNMTPVVMPLIIYFTARERINRKELLGTLIGLAGMAVLVASTYRFSPEHTAGDLICFGSMTLFALYLGLGRRNRDFQDLWLYMVPLYFSSGLFCLLAACLWPGVAPLEIYPRREYLLMLALALIPTITGHTLLNFAMKHLRGQIVAICNLSQFLFATLFGFYLNDIPGPVFIPASLLIVTGCVLAIRGEKTRPD